MGFDAWERLASVVFDEAPAVDLPGGIFVRSGGTALINAPYLDNGGQSFFIHTYGDLQEVQAARDHDRRRAVMVHGEEPAAERLRFEPRDRRPRRAHSG